MITSLNRGTELKSSHHTVDVSLHLAQTTLMFTPVSLRVNKPEMGMMMMMIPHPVPVQQFSHMT